MTGDRNRRVELKFCVSKFKGLLLAATMSMLVEYLMGLSDSIVVGNMLSEEALAGLNLLQSPMNVVSFFANLIGTGTAILFALEVGRFNRDRANQFFSQGLWSALVLGGILVTTFVLGRDAFLGFFGASREVQAYATTFWNWYVACAALELLAVLLSSSCYADGDGRICMCSYAVQLVGNCGLSIVLTHVMGMAGCALGTVLGNLGAVLTLSLHFFKKANTLKVVRHFRLRDAWSIGQASFGDASTRLCWAGLFFLLNMYVISRFGSRMLPALSVVMAVLGFSEAFNGVPTAAQPLVGVYMGENNTRGVRTVMGAAGKVALWEGFGMTALLMVFPQLAVKLVGIDDPEIAVAAETAVRLTASGLWAWAVLSLFNSYYLFIEREALACSLTFLGNFVMPVALFPAFGAVWGATGTWTALGLAPIATAAVFALFLLLRYGRDRVPLLLSKARDAKLHVFDFPLEEAKICGVSHEMVSVLKSQNVAQQTAIRVGLLVEETMMAVKDRNGAKKVIAEATLDLNEGVSLVLRDDGEIFDITDADASISSLRSYLVASLMGAQENRRNLTTTGFNRNVFRF